MRGNTAWRTSTATATLRHPSFDQGGLAGGGRAARLGDRRLQRGHPDQSQVDPACNDRAAAGNAKKQHLKAIADYDEVIRLEPKVAPWYANRGFTWESLKALDKAIADFSRAIELDPKFAHMYNDRGQAWFDKGNYDRAIADYDEAIGIDPKYTTAIYGRAVVLLLDASRWRGESGARWCWTWTAGVTIGRSTPCSWAASAQGTGRNDEAKKSLDEAAARCDADAWPYPVIKYLRGEIDVSKLLAAATDNDKMTEAPCYLGLDMEEKDRKEESLAHFGWVKEHGNRAFYEYSMALARIGSTWNGSGSGWSTVSRDAHLGIG